MLTKKSFFSSFFVVFNQMLFHFQINLTQRPVLHLYNDLINEAFQNVKGGSRINIEKELERYSKYSRSKTMFDYWPKDCWYTSINYTVICNELYISGYSGLSDLSCIDSYHQFGQSYLWYFSVLILIYMYMYWMEWRAVMLTWY